MWHKSMLLSVIGELISHLSTPENSLYLRYPHYLLMV